MTRPTTILCLVLGASFAALAQPKPTLRKQPVVLQQHELRVLASDLKDADLANSTNVVEWYRQRRGTLEGSLERAALDVQMLELLSASGQYSASVDWSGPQLDLDARMALYDELKSAPAQQSPAFVAQVSVAEAGDLYRSGRSSDARQLMQQIQRDQFKELDAIDRSRVQFVLAEISAQEADSRASAQLYLDSWKQDPSFRTARRSAVDASLAAFEQSWAPGLIIETIDETTKRGELRAAAELLNQVFARPSWESEGSLHELSAATAEYFARARVGTAEYESQWSAQLERIAEVEPAFRDVSRCYAEFPTILSANKFYEHFPHTAEDSELREAILSLLQALGETSRLRGDAPAALDYFAAAWAPEASDIERALRVIEVLGQLSSSSSDENPRVLRRVLSVQSEFIDRIFMAKGGAYRDGDLRAILQCHTILGTIFEDQERWGPADNSRSAHFQWRHALRTHEKLREQGANPNPIPGAHRGLARANAELGETERALRGYLDAAAGYHRLGSNPSALEALAAAKQLPLNWSQQQRRRVRELEASIREDGAN